MRRGQASKAPKLKTLTPDDIETMKEHWGWDHKDKAATVTLEPGAASQEEKDFANLPATRFTAPGHGSSQTVARLGISNGQSVGPAKTLTVQRGDTVTLTAYAWLTAVPNYRQAGVRGAAAVRVVPLVSLTAPTRANAARLADGSQPAGPTAPLPQVQVGVGLVPTRRGAITAGALAAIPGNAQLHYIVKDEQGTVVLDDYQSADPSQPLVWQQLQVGLRLQQGGTVELRVETMDALNSDVFFDDVRLDHTASTIVQEQHNYAYGAPMLGLNYVVGSTRYRHGYQGQYAEIDAETGTDDFELRNYDSRIGRWTAPDPYGQYASPYVGMGNNPVSSVDPDGGFSVDPFIRIIHHSADGLLGSRPWTVAINWAVLGNAARTVGQAGVNAAPFALQGAVGAGGTAVRAGQGPGQGPQQSKAKPRNPFAPDVQLGLSWQQAGTLTEFTDRYTGVDFGRVRNELPSRGAGQLGGPTLRFVEDPIYKGNYIDMRHMLVVGYNYGYGLGAGLEAAQGILPSTRPSAFHAQDYWSNALGEDFKKKYGAKLGANPSMFSEYISLYLRSPHPEPSKFAALPYAR